jgi:SAM-dependent methyltransferase
MRHMTEAVRRITACRLCGHRDLNQYIDFGHVPLGNNLQESASAARAADSYPLVLERCGTCGHFQLGHAVAPQLLYATNYTYLSGIGPSFVQHFAEYAAWVDERELLTPGAFVVDVGSNDGTCLKAFQDRGYRVCGVDPASLAAEIANDRGIDTINGFFSEDVVQQIVDRRGFADYVTSHNVLAHVDDLAAVFRNIHRLLKNKGYFAFEIGYFREVLRTGCFDTIYHEHLDYHHAAPLVRHLTALGFDVVELSVNSVQGGSLRLLLRKTGEGKLSDQSQEFLAEERRSVLYDEAFLTNWRRSIDDRMTQLRLQLRGRAVRGAKIVAYGAPTKATLLMKLAGLNGDDLTMVVDDNPHKTGRFLPATGVPIRPTVEIQEARPDVILLFAWNFAEDIISKLRGRFDKPVEALVPLPELRSEAL